MSSVTEIEAAIKKLSVAKQRIIALHLGERLGGQEHPAEADSTDEGIRFLARYESCPATRSSALKSRRRA